MTFQETCGIPPRRPGGRALRLHQETEYSGNCGLAELKVREASPELRKLTAL
jgi:hypothetical protein